MSSRVQDIDHQPSLTKDIHPAESEYDNKKALSDVSDKSETNSLYDLSSVAPLADPNQVAPTAGGWLLQKLGLRSKDRIYDLVRSSPPSTLSLRPSLTSLSHTRRTPCVFFFSPFPPPIAQLPFHRLRLTHSLSSPCRSPPRSPSSMDRSELSTARAFSPFRFIELY
jgi:hypothetical protein